MIPKSVTSDRLAAACTAFCEALGFEASYGMFPLIVTQDQVTFPTFPVDDEYKDGKPSHQLAAKFGLRSQIEGTDARATDLMILARIEVER